MSIDDTLLLAYVDNELAPEQRLEVEAAVAQSQELAERLAAMQASVLPYKAAFDRQELPPVPPELAARIDKITQSVGGERRPARRMASGWALAASFAAGAFLCAVLVLLSRTHAPTPLMSQNTMAPEWIQAVAEYQSLYTRETLVHVSEDHALTEKVIDELRHDDELSIKAPDLRGAGLTFKRVQRLSFQGHAVVQMVYLPEQGGPVALCVTHDGGSDVEPHAQRVGDMDTVAWRHGQLGYVLLAKGSPSELIDIGRQIAEGKTASLYGKDG